MLCGGDNRGVMRGDRGVEGSVISQERCAGEAAGIDPHGSLQPPSSTRCWAHPAAPIPASPPASPGIPHLNPRLGKGRAAVTHFRPACLFAAPR